MSVQFRLVGSATMGEGCGCQGDDSQDGHLNECTTCGAPYLAEVPLTADAPLVIDLTALPGFGNGASVLRLRVIGGAPVQVLFGQGNQSNQGVSLDPLLIVMCRTNPVTQITLIRTPATPTTVRIVAGSKP